MGGNAPRQPPGQVMIESRCRRFGRQAIEGPEAMGCPQWLIDHWA